MFYSASAFNQDIGGWNTASASWMSSVCSLPWHADMRAHRPWRRLGVSSLVCFRLVHACARLACFGRYRAAVAVAVVAVRHVVGALAGKVTS